MLALIWNASPQIVQLGPLELRWYGLCFAAGFIIGFQMFQMYYRWENKSAKDVESLLMHTILGTVIGARLGHCLFYEPEIYLADPIRILKIWEGGLASHGGTLGVMFAVFLFVRKHPDQGWIWLGDRLATIIPLESAFIRLGNFFNSEIVGKPTDVPWAVVFKQVDNLPRHPGQLYESLAYLFTFGVCFSIYRHYKQKTPPGLVLGVMFVLIFGARIFLELTKENQVAFENGMPLNMGQLLSIPFVFFGFFLIWRSRRVSPATVEAKVVAKKKR